MKKMVMILLAVVMLLGLITACGEASQEEVDEYVVGIFIRQSEIHNEVAIASDTVQKIINIQIDYSKEGRIDDAESVGPWFAKDELWTDHVDIMDDLLEEVQSELAELKKDTPKQCKHLFEIWEKQVETYDSIVDFVKGDNPFDYEKTATLTGLIEDFADGITDMNIEIDKLLEE